jgi:hypothetical protein
MKNSSYTMQIIEPDSGYLTQNEEVDIKNRIFSKKIWLAVNDSASNYKEITEAEYTTLKAEQDAAMKEEQDKINSAASVDQSATVVE